MKTFYHWAAMALIAAVVAVTMPVTGSRTSAQAASGFDRWVAGFWPTARSAGISRRTYRAAFKGVTPDPRIMKLASRQPEFHKPLWVYLDSAVSEKRVETGREKLRQWKKWLGRIEAKYGIDRHIVVAIWGMETSYGWVLQNPKLVRNTIRSLATLAYAGGRRRNYGRKQLLAALKIGFR